MSIDRVRNGEHDQGDGQDKEPGSSSRGVSDSISQLFRLLALEQYDKEQALILVDRVVEIGNRIGFTNGQATLVVQLALRVPAKQSHGTGIRLALKLLKSVHPARGEQFGQDLVLLLLGALGPAEDALIDGNSQLRSADAQAGSSNGESSDDEDATETSGGRRRRKVALRIQAAAIKLLALLSCPAPVLHIDAVASEEETLPTAPLPAHFLTSSGRRALDNCYGSLFHFLDYQSLRPHLCHLLHALTRRKHVRRYRIAKLLFLCNASPSDASIELLTAKYSQHSPQLHYASVTSGQPSDGAQQKTPRYPDIQWLLAVNSIWSQAHQSVSEADRPRKRRRMTSQAPTSDGAGQVLHSLPIRMPLLGPTFLRTIDGRQLTTECISFKGLGYMYDRLQLPDHLVSALVHQMTRIALLVEGESKHVMHTISRISRWTTSAVSEEMNLVSPKSMLSHPRAPGRNIVSQHKTTSMLQALSAMVEIIGYCPDELQTWACRLFEASVWPGLTVWEKRALLRLVQSFLPQAWSLFSTSVMTPLTKLLDTSPATEAARVIGSLQRMIEKWVLGRDWSELASAAQRGESVRLGFVELTSDVDYLDTIERSIEAIVHYSSLVLLRCPDSIDVMDATLAVYESIFTPAYVGLHGYNLPLRYVFILLSMSQHGAVSSLSRISAVMKQILDLQVREPKVDSLRDSERLPAHMEKNKAGFYSDDSRDAFNGCLEFLFGLVWKGDAFGQIEMGDFEAGVPSSFIQQLSERCDQRGQRLARVGSISHGSNLAPLMEAHANTLGSVAHANVKGPITAYGLNEASKGSFPSFEFRRFRLRHMDWLGENGAVGLQSFFNSAYDPADDGATSETRSRYQSTIYE